MKATGIFNTHSCYVWLEYGGVSKKLYKSTSSTFILLKLVLRLVQNNKVLTKDNLKKKCWQGDDKYIFYNELKIIEHFFHTLSNILMPMDFLCQYPYAYGLFR
jgi:hypothetical protein